MKENNTVKKCFFVIAELSNSDSKYKKLKKTIAAYESSVQVTKNCWAIVSGKKNSEEIWKDLSSAFFQNDRVMVLSNSEACWYNVICTDAWLQYNLGGGEKIVRAAV